MFITNLIRNNYDGRFGISRNYYNKLAKISDRFEAFNINDLFNSDKKIIGKIFQNKKIKKRTTYFLIYFYPISLPFLKYTTNLEI